MELIVHERFKRMSAMIAGAIAFYEIEGDEINEGRRQQQKDGLVTGMEAMDTALYWLQPSTRLQPVQLGEIRGNSDLLFAEGG